MKNSTVGLIVVGIFVLLTIAYSCYVIFFHIPEKQTQSSAALITTHYDQAIPGNHLYLN